MSTYPLKVIFDCNVLLQDTNSENSVQQAEARC